MDEVQKLVARIDALERQLRDATMTPQLPTSDALTGIGYVPTGQVDADGHEIYETVETLRATPDGIQVLAATTPPTPTEPAVTSGPGFIRVAWDGLFEEGEVAPEGTRIQVHAGLVDEEVIPSADTVRATLVGLEGEEVVVGLDAGQYIVALVAVNAAGDWSEPSLFTDGEPGGAIVAVDEVARADAAQAKADAAAADAKAETARVAAEAADQKAVLAQTAADGKSKHFYSTLEADPQLGADGDTWWQYDAAGVIIGVWERKEGAWAARAIGNEVIDAISAGKIATGTLGVGVSINVGDPTAAHLVIDASGPGITVYRPDGDGGLEPSTVLGGEVDQFAINRDGMVLAGISSDGGISGQSLTIASDQVTIDGENLHGMLWEYAWGYQGGFTAPADSIVTNPASEGGRNLMNVKWRMIPGRRYEIRFRMNVVTQGMMDGGRLYLGFHYGVNKDPDAATDPRIEDVYVFYPKGMSPSLIQPVYGSFLIPYSAEAEQTGAVAVNMRNPYWDNSAFNTWTGYLYRTSRFSVYDVGPYRPQDTANSGVMYTAGGSGGTPATQSYVKTYSCTWGKTWTGANPHSAAGQEAWHGNSGWQFRGQLGYQSWVSDVSGATISKVEVYLYCRYTYYSSGADIGIGVHSNASAPSGFTGAAGTTTVHFAKPEGKWVPLPSSWYPNFANGTWKGISINPNGVYTPATYAKICGTYEGAGHVASQVRITYTK